MWHRDPDTRFVPPGDDFWDTVWRSDEFRAALADPADPYRRVVAAARLRPWWYVPVRHPQERQHFGTWFGRALGQRAYTKPLVHDLFLLHELLHACSFVDDPRGTEASWRYRMRANEIAVSLETEVLVYARHPTWRAHTFSKEIWADRFDLRAVRGGGPGARRSRRLGSEQQLWRRRPQASETPWILPHAATASFPAYADLWQRRRLAARQPQDALEETIRRYEGSADAFFHAWRPYWRHVERERVAFDDACSRGAWRSAVRRRERWWEVHADAQGIPYGGVACKLWAPDHPSPPDGSPRIRPTPSVLPETTDP